MAWPAVVGAIASVIGAYSQMQQANKGQPAQLPNQGQGSISMEPTFAEAIKGGVAPNQSVQAAGVPAGQNPIPATGTFNAVPGQEMSTSFRDAMRPTAYSDLAQPGPIKADSTLLKETAPPQATGEPTGVDLNAAFDPSTATPPPQKASIFGDMTGSEKAMIGAQLMSEVFKRRPGPPPPGLPSSSFSPMTPQFNRRY